MLLHTIMPESVIFDGLEDEEDESRHAHPLEMRWGDAIVFVTPSGMGLCTVARICTTNTRHYLDPRLQPGSRLPLWDAVEGAAGEAGKTG